MNYIKRQLFKILGLKSYLKLISSSFFFMYKLGVLKLSSTFDHHYFVKKLIKKGNTVIDIGANLGYYSVLFAELVGDNGSVFSVEPVEPYREVLKRNIRKYSNVNIIPYALGKDKIEEVKMGIPLGNRYFSHGRTQIMDTEFDSEYVFRTTIMNPVDVFDSLNNLDYIKCDIEGYEGVVIPEMMSIISKYLPVIQIETSGDTKNEISDLLSTLGYSVYNLVNSKLCREDENQIESVGDIFFIPEARKNEMPAALLTC